MTEMTMIIKDVKDVPLMEPPLAPGVYTKIMIGKGESEKLLVGMQWLDPGAKLDSIHPHYHSEEEFQLVLNGYATLTDCNGDKHLLSPGTMFYCPKGLGGAHGIENTGDVPMSFLFILPQHEFDIVRHIPDASERQENEMIIKNIKDIDLSLEQYPGTTMKLLLGSSNAEKMLVSIMWWQPGAKLIGIQPHYHSEAEFQIVLYGNMTLTDCNGDTHQISQGMMFHCPPNEGGIHGIENTDDFPMMLLCAFPMYKFDSFPPLKSMKFTSVEDLKKFQRARALMQDSRIKEE